MRIVRNLLAVAVLVASIGGSLRADEGLLLADERLPAIQLYDDAPSAIELQRAKPTAAELRQARALERRRQRVARMEADAWAGYSPLRPTVAANPYTQTRTLYVRPYSIWSVWDLIP